MIFKYSLFAVLGMLLCASQALAADAYEPDDSYAQAKPITVDDMVGQSHSSEVSCDLDYVSFPAIAGKTYVLETFNLAPSTDTTLTLFSTNGTTVLDFSDDNIGLESQIIWLAPFSGTFFLMQSEYACGYSAVDTYSMRVYVLVPTPTPSISATRTVSPTFSVSPTVSPTRTVSPTFSVSPTASPTRSASPTFSVSPTFSATPSISPSPTPLPPALPFPWIEPLESGAGAWTIGGLWHLVDTGSINPYALADSPTHSAYYGQDSTGTYDTGAANSGSMTSPVIFVPGGSVAPTLKFSSWYQTESSSTTWDTRKVFISANGGAFALLTQLSGDTMSVWNHPQYSLSAYKGLNIQLRFSFDTIDSFSNSYRGWYVDDIKVEELSGTPTQTRTVSPTFSITPTFSLSPTFSVSPTFSLTPTISATWSISPTFSPTPTFSVTPTPSNTPLGTIPVAVDAPSLVFVCGGSSPWYYQTGNYETNGSAAQAGLTGNSQISWMETTLTGPGTLSFDWTVSSQSGSDYLHLYVDGLDQGGAISGLYFFWMTRNISIGSGTHTVRWAYVKDSSGFGNSDTGWVDNIQWTSYAPTPLPALGAVRPGKIYSYPNPYRRGGGKKLQFVFEPASSAAITIFDWGAARVGVLAASAVLPSFGYAYWDGSTLGGGKVVPGVYFAILKTEKGSMSCKFTVLP